MVHLRKDLEEIPSDAFVLQKKNKVRSGQVKAQFTSPADKRGVGSKLTQSLFDVDAFCGRVNAGWEMTTRRSP